jgi:hypothetical protein
VTASRRHVSAAMPRGCTLRRIEAALEQPRSSCELMSDDTNAHADWDASANGSRERGLRVRRAGASPRMNSAPRPGATTGSIALEELHPAAGERWPSLHSSSLRPPDCPTRLACDSLPHRALRLRRPARRADRARRRRVAPAGADSEPRMLEMLRTRDRKPEPSLVPWAASSRGSI